MINPLTGNAESVRAVLRSMAGQEGCDGEPYDQMQEASDYIAKLEDTLLTIHNLTVTDHGAYEKIHMIHTLCDTRLGHTHERLHKKTERATISTLVARED